MDAVVTMPGHPELVSGYMNTVVAELAEAVFMDPGSGPG
jgi:hypothetical protein